VLGGGSVWVADSVDDVVRKIDPHTDAVVETIRLGNRPGALAYTADRLWVSVY
jgi:YVTN family beta-propeller protein